MHALCAVRKQPMPDARPQPPEPPPPPPSPPPETSTAAASATPAVTLLQPSQRKRSSGARSTRIYRAFKSAFRSLPILTPVGVCRLPPGLNLSALHTSHSDGHTHGATRATGTLFGHRKARVSLAFQDTPRSLPTLVIEIAVPTGKFMQELGTSGLVRVALECEKRPRAVPRLLEEPTWTAFVNGRSVGYATRREATEEDLAVMKLLHAVSMGAGVLPADMTDPNDGELTYMRAHFDHVIGSKDSETFYMLNPDNNSSTELTIFFIRL